MQKYKNTLIYYNINTYFNRFCNENIIYSAVSSVFTPLLPENSHGLLRWREACIFAAADALCLTEKARGCFLSVKKQPLGMRNTAFCAVKRSGSENCDFYNRKLLKTR